MAAVPEKPLGVTLTSAAKKQKGGHGSPPIHAAYSFCFSDPRRSA
jgi:hypothetical protein